ncbi:MAG: D-alanyl-D-alanine carboxypeptidase/D-alanyl-D-alanine-endopeptidase [Ilumatobacteraceae bacterium]
MSPARQPAVNPLVALTVVALVPAVILFVLWRWAAGHADGAEPPPPTTTVDAPPAPSPVLTTPLLSFRRAPAVLARDVNLPAFQTAVADFGATLGAPSCVAVDVDGTAVGSTRADQPLIPASNQKILVAAVALEVLGADRTFTTEVRGAAPVGGTVAGDVYLVGGGDPLLTSSTYPVQNDPNPVTSATSLDALADTLVAAGVQRVDGGIVGDASRYDDEYFAPSWVNDVRGIEAGPYDALMVNDARVTGDPLRATEPAEAAAREFASLLQSRGIVVAGTPTAGSAPPDADVLGSIQSAPMSAVVGEMLSTSDNNTAELLVKELGVSAGGAGTRDAGLAVMASTLSGWGIPMAGVQLADGSGLSNDNRVTCQVFVDVLSRSGPTDPLGAGLPVAGVSGTLTDVFTDSPVAGHMQAKTGTLGNAPYNADPPAVKSLSGYLPVEGGGAIEFSLLLNAAGTLTDQSVYRPVWDDFAAMLATYPAGPTPADLAPR